MKLRLIAVALTLLLLAACASEPVETAAETKATTAQTETTTEITTITEFTEEQVVQEQAATTAITNTQIISPIAATDTRSTISEFYHRNAQTLNTVAAQIWELRDNYRPWDWSVNRPFTGQAFTGQLVNIRNYSDVEPDLAQNLEQLFNALEDLHSISVNRHRFPEDFIARGYPQFYHMISFSFSHHDATHTLFYSPENRHGVLDFFDWQFRPWMEHLGGNWYIFRHER